jgi:hypothetical protein
VTFFINGVERASAVTDTNGQATLSGISLGPGVWIVVATYHGSTNFLASSSLSFFVDVF